jgi:hypothetical protein
MKHISHFRDYIPHTVDFLKSFLNGIKIMNMVNISIVMTFRTETELVHSYISEQFCECAHLFLVEQEQTKAGKLLQGF